MRLLLLSIPFLLLLALVGSIFFWPNVIPVISVILPVVSISIALFITTQKHWRSYQKAECTREKMIRNLTLDILSFFVTMAAAICAGGKAGGYVGLRTGMWIGLLAGFTGGFVAAWMVRSIWSRMFSFG